MAKVRRITLVDQVVDELGRLIRETWEGGEELPSISELGEQFGVSRAVVREALKALEAQGMVEVANGKRAKVVRESTRPLLRYFANALSLDASANGEIIDLWHALEGNAVAMAAVNRSENELSALRELIQQCEGQTHDPMTFDGLDSELHDAILHAAHNRILLDLVHSLRDTLLDPPAEAAAGGTETEHMRLNARLVDAIARGDAHAARRTMEQHLVAVPPPRSENSPHALPDRSPLSPA